jgi:hypothetical protein
MEQRMKTLQEHRQREDHEEWQQRERQHIANLEEDMQVSVKE